MSTIDDIRVKVYRAKEHLDAFDEEVIAFLKTNPYRFSSEFESKGGLNYDWVFHIHIKQEPPIRLSAIFGDGLYNIRSALDHLAYSLSVSHVGLNADFNGVEFPIFSDQRRYMGIDTQGIQQPKGNVWRRSGLYKVRHMHPLVQALIERLQPYHGGDNLILRAVHELSVIDKHQRFHLLGAPLGKEWSAGVPFGDEGFAPVKFPFDIHGFEAQRPPYEDGTEVVRYHITVPLGFDFKVRVRHKISGDVVLDDWHMPEAYAGQVLAGMVGFVRRRILPDLQSYLS